MKQVRSDFNTFKGSPGMIAGSVFYHNLSPGLRVAREIKDLAKSSGLGANYVTSEYVGDFQNKVSNFFKPAKEFFGGISSAFRDADPDTKRATELVKFGTGLAGAEIATHANMMRAIRASKLDSVAPSSLAKLGHGPTKLERSVLSSREQRFQDQMLELSDDMLLERALTFTQER